MAEVLKKIFIEDIELPGMPDVAAKIIAALEDELCSIEKLEEIILKDISLTATILRIANSPLYSKGKPVERVSEAMLMIGLQNVVPFVCVAVLANNYSVSQNDNSVINHLLAVSKAASLLSSRVGAFRIRREVATVAGLMHDIGKLILYSSIPEEYKKIREQAQNENVPLHQLETSVLGFNHCLIGAAVATKWSLPVPYREAIRRHHEEDVKKEGITEIEALCYLIRISDKLVFDSGNELFVSGEVHLCELLSALKIDEKSYRQVADKIKESESIIV